MKGETSALAIAEKRPQRSGGCTGIFFQLLNWNRRLAKKKLLSKELLLPARARRASKEFGSDEKLPMAKFRLIADENCGGFPSAKKPEMYSACSLVDAEQNDGMRTPGVVARLMGLESMPAVRCDKLKKASCQGKNSAKHFDDHGEDSKFLSSAHDLNSEKGLVKVNSGPLKLQKTGFFDRRPVNRLGAEALQLKNVFSRSKKQRQKLVSPVKSTRDLSGRNAPRLMAAATKILEPGLKESNRAKYSLTYSASRNHSLKHQTRIEGMVVKQSTQTSYPFTANSFKGQSLCNSCGNLLDVTDYRPNVGQQVPGLEPSASEFSNASLDGLEKSKLKSSVLSLEKERDSDSQRSVILINQDRPMSLAAQARVNVLSRTRNSTERKPHLLKEQDASTSSLQNRPLNGLKHNNLRQKGMFPVKDEVLPRPKSFRRQSGRYASAASFNGDKDYIALNRNVNNRSMRTRMPMKASGHSKIGMERNALDSKNESSSLVRTLTQKRGPMNSNPRVENTGFPDPTFVNQRSVGSDAINGNGNWKGFSTTSSKDAGIVSFTFSSPMRHGTRIFSCVELAEKQKGQGMLSCNASHHKKVISDAKTGNSLPQRETDLRGDALRTLIEQKLREISCLDADDLAKVDSLPGISTASILEELVSSLTAGRPFSQVNGDESSVNSRSNDSLHSLDTSDCNSIKGRMFNANTKFQADAKALAFTRCSLPSDCDRHSPTSILKASFSNDSCLSGSFDGSLDSMASMNLGMPGSGNLTDSIISGCGMHGFDSAEIGSAGNKLNYDTELLFENLALYETDYMGSTLVEALLNKLETLADIPLQHPRCCLGLTESKKENQLRSYLFDCVMEFFDSKYGPYCKSGFRSWTKLPSSLSIEQLTREVYEEIGRWAGLAGKIVDEKIGWDMRSSLGKWTNFDVEAFEMGTVIEEDVFQILLNEIMMDLR